MPTDLETFAGEAVAREELERALKTSLRQLSKAKASRDEMVSAVYRAAHDAALVYPHPAPIKRANKGKPGDHWALAHLTDWQRGKVTVSYSSEIADKRVGQCVQKIMRLTDLQRHVYRVSSCALLLGGDMIEGTTIFAKQAWEVDASLFDQLFGCAALIEKVVRTLLTEFDRVEVWEERGNHGRIGRFGEQPSEDNVDSMAYKIARDRIGANKRLVWHPIKNFYNHGVIGNYSFMLVHGDEIKSFGGNVPAFGIMRKCNSWASGVVEKFNDVYMGHFHTPQQLSLANGGSVYVTGTTESDSEYAREFCAATGKPHQRLHFIDPHAGRVAAMYDLWLD
jgi:hypothetical protein